MELPYQATVDYLSITSDLLLHSNLGRTSRFAAKRQSTASPWPQFIDDTGESNQA
jgi:hypothetical protein